MPTPLPVPGAPVRLYRVTSPVPGSALTLVVEIEPGDEPVHGRVGRSDGTLDPFVGWTELAVAIERFRLGGVYRTAG